MKAIHVSANDCGTTLELVDVADLIPDVNEVVIDVRAAGVNRADLAQRNGNYPPPPGVTDVLGLEVAGTIAALGTNVTGRYVGERVCALLSGGGYATKAVVHQRLLMPIPDDWSFEQAAALPEVFLTAFVNLFLEGELSDGQDVLIHGGGSGVGTAGIQLARQEGCRVIVTAGSFDKLDRCKKLGADTLINYKTEDFVERTLTATDGKGVDVILDMVGGSYLERNLKSLKKRGRLVIIAFLDGPRAELPLPLLMTRRLRIIGSVLRSRSLNERSEIRDRFVERFWPRIVDGSLIPIVDSVFDLKDVEQAHQRLREFKNFGKIILLMPGEG